nr:hypothetical protein [Tanacetum cinerariifolium]
MLITLDFKSFLSTNRELGDCQGDAKLRLIRWVLLLQGFDIEIKDKRGVENLDAGHLSRLENLDLGTFTEEEITDEFPDKHLMILTAKLNNNEPWRCVAGNEILEILAHCHFGPTGGHHSAPVTGRKVYESGFFWPGIFKDAKDYVMRFDACKRPGNISLRSEMPQSNIQVNVLDPNFHHGSMFCKKFMLHVPPESNEFEGEIIPCNANNKKGQNPSKTEHKTEGVEKSTVKS